MAILAYYIISYGDAFLNSAMVDKLLGNWNRGVYCRLALINVDEMRMSSLVLVGVLVTGESL